MSSSSKVTRKGCIQDVYERVGESKCVGLRCWLKEDRIPCPSSMRMNAMEENVVWVLYYAWARFAAPVNPSKLRSSLLCIKPVHADLLDKKFSLAGEVKAP